MNRSIHAYLTRPAANPRHLALSYAGCAALMAVAAAWLARIQPAGWVQLQMGVTLLLLAFLAFGYLSWRGEHIRWNGRARWGIVVALAGVLALILPL
ncbi:hypothetical protein [Longimicrobium terrae]|uniref:Uncharacterized protein n=1 Tax=Longimicrobium terrae TaxID=1639882 RepID=A0A841GKF0_9BACT|nr:hypothetical protein [Longimicrobium terrae]MBB4634806.1 hypothetical protein [Longimicrobium terrae]MBB6069201.1 hypothetical protein [Longimicrobium terrae]NNC31987.1 hypothetical protein [Longimicrobium terrae]